VRTATGFDSIATVAVNFPTEFESGKNGSVARPFRDLPYLELF
jgi:hypothetical protein